MFQIIFMASVLASPEPKLLEIALGHQPQAAIDAKGRVLVVYADNENTIWLTKSTDGSTSRSGRRPPA